MSSNGFNLHKESIFYGYNVVLSRSALTGRNGKYNQRWKKIRAFAAHENPILDWNPSNDIIMPASRGTNVK